MGCVQLSLFPLEGGGAPEVGDVDYIAPEPSKPVVNDFFDPCPTCELREFCGDECGRHSFALFVNREPKHFSEWLRHRI